MKLWKHNIHPKPLDLLYHGIIAFFQAYDHYSKIRQFSALLKRCDQKKISYLTYLTYYEYVTLKGNTVGSRYLDHARQFLHHFLIYTQIFKCLI